MISVCGVIGYPAKKRSVRETLMRKGLKADDRKPFGELFFDGSFDKPLGQGSPFAEALEMVRWAPSATNVQPWRAVVDGDAVNFFEAKTLKDSGIGDVQMVELGIAIAHFDAVLEEHGVSGTYEFCDPGIPAPQNTHYIATFRKA